MAGPRSIASSWRRLFFVLALSCWAGCASHGNFSEGLYQRKLKERPWLGAKGDIGVDPSRYDVRQTLLASGLRVGVERAPTRGMVGVVLVVGAGSVDDPRGKEGLAHLVEHLTFHATFEGRPTTEVVAHL